MFFNFYTLNHGIWRSPQVRQFIWESMLDYRRIDWRRTLKAVSRANSDAHTKNTLGAFDSKWLNRYIFGHRVGSTVRWKLIPPGGIIPNWLQFSFVTWFRSQKSVNCHGLWSDEGCTLILLQ